MSVKPPEPAAPAIEPAAPVVPPKNNDITALEAKNAQILEEKKKLADAKAKTDAELEEYRKKDREAARKKLEDEGNYKEALEAKDKELADKNAKLDLISKKVQDGHKLSAFLKNVGGSVDEKYWGLIDLTSVKIDEATGDVDKASAVEAAKGFVEKYGNEIVQRQDPSPLPPHAPKGGGGNGSNPITLAEWRKLPTSKEMRERRKDIID